MSSMEMMEKFLLSSMRDGTGMSALEAPAMACPGPASRLSSACECVCGVVWCVCGVWVCGVYVCEVCTCGVVRVVCTCGVVCVCGVYMWCRVCGVYVCLCVCVCACVHVFMLYITLHALPSPPPYLCHFLLGVVNVVHSQQ